MAELEPLDGFVDMVAPDGRTGRVPKDKVQAVSAFGFKPMAQGQQPTIGGQIGGYDLSKLPARLPANLQSAILEHLSKQDIARETTARAMGVQGLKGDQAYTTIDQATADALTKKSGIPFHAGQSVHNSQLNALVKPISSKPSDNDAENRKVLTDYAAKNKVALDALRPGGMGGWNSANLATVADMIRNHPDYDLQNLKLAYSGKEAATKAAAASEARAPNSPGMFKIRAMSNSLIPQLDSLSEASDAVARGDIKTINSLKGKIGAEFSDKDWSALKKRAMLVADEFQAQVGAGSDSKLDLAKQLLDSSDSPQVMGAAVKMLREAVKARAIASTGRVPTKEEIYSESGGVSLPSMDAISAELKKRGH